MSSKLGIEQPCALLPSSGRHVTWSRRKRLNPGRNQRLEPVNPWKNELFKVYSVKVDSAFEEFTKKLASDPSTKVKDVTILQEDFFSLCRFSNSSCSVV